MRRRLDLAREILWKPLWWTLSALWWVVAKLPTVVETVGNLSGRDFSHVGAVLTGSPLFVFLSTYWVPILVIAYVCAIADGIFTKARVYLGDEVRAQIRTEEFPQNATIEPHLSLKVFNDEKVDLTQCRVRLVELKHLYNPSAILDRLEEVNPNNLAMTWGGGSPTEYMTIPRNGDNKVLNVCKSTGAGLVFLFHGHEQPLPAHGKFSVGVLIDGILGDRPIAPIACRFCFEYGTLVGAETREKIGEGGRQRIIIQASSLKATFAFADCSKQAENEGPA